MKTNIHPMWQRGLAASLALAAAAAAQATPIITSVVEVSGGEPNKPARFTGNTFNHPNLGANYVVRPITDEIPAYNDRTHQLTGYAPGQRILPYLEGGEYIMNANDARDNFDLQLDVTVTQPVAVYLLIDNRNGDGANANPPNLELNLQWVIDEGFTPVTRGLNRTGNRELPDEVGIDESADGAGPGAGLNQWFSVYSKKVPAGTFSLYGNNQGGQNMWVAVVQAIPANPYIVSSPGGVTGFSVQLENGGSGSLNTNGLALTLNGSPVNASSVTQADGITTISFNSPAPLASRSTNTVTVDYALSTSGRATNTFNFVVEYYATLTSEQSIPAASVNTASSGFTARVAQFRTSAGWPGNDLPNTIRRAEEQLAGILIDPATGGPATNFAIAGPAGGAYILPVINWNQEMNPEGSGAEIGSVQSGSDPAVAAPLADEPIPGIPGSEPDQPASELRDNIAAEIIGYLNLQPGLYRLGVNSDDGFRLTAGSDPHGAGNVELGSFNGGRGSADSLFYVRVMDAGIYPVRLIWFEGGGGANLEFFSINASGRKVLINDRANGGITSYASAAAGADAPDFVATPYNGQMDVWPTDVIIAKFTDRDTIVAPHSVQLKINGQVTPALVSKTGGVTTLTFDYPGSAPSDTPVTVEVTYTDSANKTYTQTWAIRTVNTSLFPSLLANTVVPATAIDRTATGFKVDVYQMPSGRTGFTDNNSSAAAEHQLARMFIDPATSQPYENLATPGQGPNGTHIVQTLNWNEEFDQTPQRGGFQLNNNNPDDPIPGVEPGNPNNIVAEAFAYLELKAGAYRFGVNSDDGFKVTTGSDPKATNGPTLGIFNTGRGAADTLFDFVAPADGFYPIRLLWWEGSGDASLEFFSVDPITGYRTLINSPTGIKAYWKANAVVRPVLNAITLSGSSVTVSYSGGTLQSTTSLSAPNWTDVGSTGTHTEPVSTAQRKFFRVRP